MENGMANPRRSARGASAVSRFFKSIQPNQTAAFLFALYLGIGLFIAGDYGISADEATERRTSLVNYAYVMGDVMRASDSEAVREILDSVPPLSEYLNRFYGASLQSLTVLIEHMRGFEMTTRDIYLLRHVFTFVNYWAAGVFFYLIFKRRFGNTWLPVLGALLYIVYPRFFGEAFYNIKDILFYAWFVIAAYFVLRWLEDGRARFTLGAAMALAVAINTRILGVSLLLLGCAVAFIAGIRREKRLKVMVGKPLMLGALTFACYVAITPFLWASPIENAYRIFLHFMDFQPWSGRHLYLGEMITREVPWHYIPVWMGVTVPVLYMVMFGIGTAAIGAGLWAFLRRRRKGAGSDGALLGKAGVNTPAGTHLYDLFFAVLFFATLLGYILLRISMYEGWRHAYSIFCPFLYITALGLSRAVAFVRGRQRGWRWGFGCAVAALLICQAGWIAMNHPYQYVYFNALGRGVAEQNFSLDYWQVSHGDLIRYALANDERPQITVGGSNRATPLFLKEEEKSRVAATDDVPTDYYLQNTRMAYHDRLTPAGFTEVKAITVDGMNIAKLFRRVTPAAAFDADAWAHITRFESNGSESDFAVLHDGDYTTRWTTGDYRRPGDYMMFAFDAPVDYDYFSFVETQSVYDYPIELSIFTSTDGAVWTEQMAQSPIPGDYRMTDRPEPYRFLKLVNQDVSENTWYWWTADEMLFGRAER